LLERAGRFIEREFGRGLLGNQKEAIETEKRYPGNKTLPRHN